VSVLRQRELERVVHWLVIGLSLGSALSSSISTTLKKAAASRVPAVFGGGLGGLGGLARFARATAANPLWLTALLADFGGVGLQVTALHFGALALVQPLLVSGVAVRAAAAPPGQLVDHLAGGRLGCAADRLPDRFPWPVRRGHRQPVRPRRPRRRGHRHHRHECRGPPLLGRRAASGATRRSGRPDRRGGRGDIRHHRRADQIRDRAAGRARVARPAGQLYTALVVAAGGLFLAQVAFQAGPLTASLPAISTIDSLLSVLIGVLIYDEHLRRGPGSGAVLLTLMILLVIAVIGVGRVETTSEPHPHGEPGP